MMQMFSGATRAFIGALGVSAACLVSVVLAPSSPAPALVLSCLAFAVLGTVSGRSAVIGAVAVGGLELAFILPGQGFAVSNADDALGLIGAVATGLLIAWRAGWSDDQITALSADVDAWQLRAQHAAAARDELSDRAISDIATIAALASTQASAAAATETREAMDELAARLDVLGRIYRRLRVGQGDEDQVDARTFLTELSTDLCHVRLAARPSAVRLAIEPIALPSATIVVVGLILNELLTNVYRHASPGDHPGHLSIVFTRHLFQPDRIRLVVTDDRIGGGRHRDPEEQPRSAFVDALANHMEGDLSYARLDKLTMATFEFTATS
jgi:two-component sensor histidine kinase